MKEGGFSSINRLVTIYILLINYPLVPESHQSKIKETQQTNMVMKERFPNLGSLNIGKLI